MQNANLLLYVNLSGEVFYIIAHRMRSQKVTDELQLRVYNDLAVAICHPTVIQNLIRGDLELLELNLADVRTLMDRIVHSSIMTVNAFSMEKLFELTLIATRYQYTVCHHPTDILLIALNHLDSVRKLINDAIGVQLTKNLHSTLIDRMKDLSSAKMQDYRYAILTYLGDVKLKMTNLIRLGLQKPTGEFVKEFPDKIFRPEFSQPGKIEIDESPVKDYEEIESDSESNGDGKDEEGDEDDEDEEVDATIAEKLSPDEGEVYEDQGCHSEPIPDINDLKKMVDYEKDEVLEILSENEFSEFHESDKPNTKIRIIHFKKDGVGNLDTQELICSFELNGNRGITLGLSIYDIPGNSDEEITTVEYPSVTRKFRTQNQSIPCHSKVGNESTSSGHLPEFNDFIDLKAVQGLDLCSILLGCQQSTGNADLKQILYHSPAEFSNDASKIESSPDRNIDSDVKMYKVRNITPNTEGIEGKTRTRCQVSGINIIQFDANTDRSGSKAALARISKEFDIEKNDEALNESTSSARSPFDFVPEED